MIERTLTAKLRQAATQFPAVTVTGPRQSGKTTLVRAVFKEYEYVSLELPGQRSGAGYENPEYSGGASVPFPSGPSALSRGGGNDHPSRRAYCSRGTRRQEEADPVT